MVESISEQLKDAALRLSEDCNRGSSRILRHKSVAHVTNPLDYAWAYHEKEPINLQDNLYNNGSSV